MIRSNLVKRLFRAVKDVIVIGIDNMNDNYDACQNRLTV